MASIGELKEQLLSAANDTETIRDQIEGFLTEHERKLEEVRETLDGTHDDQVKQVNESLNNVTEKLENSKNSLNNAEELLSDYADRI